MYLTLNLDQAMASHQTQNVDRILVVDDALDNLLFMQTALAQNGYQTSLAEDGETAFAMVKEAVPDLILLDVMMPGMDGYELTRQIRQTPAMPYIPILLITASEQSSVVKGLDSGADDFIRKPVDLDELMARVRSLLRLKHSIAAQEAMMRQREDFVSRLAHDLRTPLVASDRMFDLFQKEMFGPLSLEMHQAVKSMSRSNKNLMELVNTLLEVYRHDAGCKALTFIPCNLEELLHEVTQQLLPLATEKNLTLTVNRSPLLAADTNSPHGCTILGDRLELHRVFTNLIGNAIKFTETGGIQVHLTSDHPDPAHSEAEAGRSWLTVAINDTGVGIPPNQQAELFERFRTGSHRSSGSGLGLYLSRCIIESHQGTIQLQSALGQGSTFTVCLPTQPIAAS
jgi:two-component system, sensor histidine kinase and response regulator